MRKGAGRNETPGNDKAVTKGGQSNNMQEKSKIALVTGGSGGLGKNMALRLAQTGSDVIITFHSKVEEAALVVAAIEAFGQKGTALQFDVGDISALDGFVERLFHTLSSKWGTTSFDFLINNAGIGATIPFAQITESDFDLFLNIHFKGVFFLTQKLLPRINDHGRIVNVSSNTTRVCVPGYSVYASMKGAIETFTKYLAKEVGPRGIAVNVLAPGPIETNFNNAILRNNPQRKEMMATQAALGRVGQAEDIGGIVAFLCSDDSYWITGQRIEASGGMSL